MTTNMIPMIRATNADPNDTTKTIDLRRTHIFYKKKHYFLITYNMRVTKEIAHTWNNDRDRLAVSFQCEKKLWLEFDKFMTDRYGNYKKSILIESLIRKYLKKKTNATTITSTMQ